MTDHRTHGCSEIPARPLPFFPVRIDPRLPHGTILVLSKGLTPGAVSGRLLHMAEDMHPPIGPPSNSMAGSAAFFDQDSPDALGPDDFIAPGAATEPPRLAYLKSPASLNPGGGPVVARPISRPVAPEAFIPRRTTSVLGPSLHSPLRAIDIMDNRPSATIVMKRTLRPGRQRWTWWLRENSTGTKMCFGRHYANYDEAVEYAHKCTSGYRVQANVVGDKPKGR